MGITNRAVLIFGDILKYRGIVHFGPYTDVYQHLQDLSGHEQELLSNLLNDRRVSLTFDEIQGVYVAAIP